MARPTLGNWVWNTHAGYGELDLPAELWDAQSAVMDMTEAFQKRQKTRRARHPVPEVLFHYTDSLGLQGMMENLRLRLTHASFMNDPLEGSWIYKQATTAINILGESKLADQTRIQIENQFTVEDLWDNVIRNNGEEGRLSAAFFNSVSPAFIASFSEDGDLLSQWRAYGASGEGFSIGFDLTKLQNSPFFETPDRATLPVLVKVEYDENVQQEEIAWLLKTADEAYQSYKNILEGSEDASSYFVRLFLDPLRDAFASLRWEFKSPGYKEEKEWRIVVNPIFIIRPHFRVSKIGIVPFIEINLPHEKSRPLDRLAIPEIVLGPKCPNLATTSIRMMMQNIAYPSIERSKLALR